MLWRAFYIAPGGFPLTRGRISTLEPARSSSETGVAFVFTGQGAQYADMGLSLMQYPIYEATLRHIDALYHDLGCEWSIFGAV